MQIQCNLYNRMCSLKIQLTWSYHLLEAIVHTETHERAIPMNAFNHFSYLKSNFMFHFDDLAQSMMIVCVFSSLFLLRWFLVESHQIQWIEGVIGIKMRPNNCIQMKSPKFLTFYNEDIVMHDWELIKKKKEKTPKPK